MSDIQVPLNLPETADPPEGKFETINGQHFKVGTLDEFSEAVFGKPIKRSESGFPTFPGGLILGVMKFKPAAGKFYRLVWVSKAETWLAAEDLTAYQTRRATLVSGYELAARTGAYFDEG